IEDGAKIVVLSRELLGLGHLEGDAIGEALGPSGFPSGFDRFVVIVESVEAGVGVGLGHQDGGGALAAAHVGHTRAGLKLLLDAVEGRNPRSYQIGGISGTEELFAAVKYAVGVFMPAHAGARTKRLGNAWHSR